MTAKKEEEAVVGGETRVLERLWPDEIEHVIVATASMTKFRKLALAHDLLFHIQGTRVWVGPTFYASKSKEHNIGDVKAEEFEQRVISLTMTDMKHFGAQAYWYERFPRFRDGRPKPPEFQFDNALVGGQKTGGPTKFFTTVTPMTEEITRCLTA